MEDDSEQQNEIRVVAPDGRVFAVLQWRGTAVVGPAYLAGPGGFPPKSGPMALVNRVLRWAQRNSSGTEPFSVIYVHQADCDDWKQVAEYHVDGTAKADRRVQEVVHEIETGTFVAPPPEPWWNQEVDDEDEEA